MQISNPGEVKGLPLIIRKTTTEVVNNSVVLQNDDELFFPVLANEIWAFWLYLRTYSATPNPDIKIAFSIPALASIWRSTSILESLNEIDATALFKLNAAAVVQASLIRHLYLGGSNPGNVQLQWAQFAAVAEDTEVRSSSYIIAHLIG